MKNTIWLTRTVHKTALESDQQKLLFGGFFVSDEFRLPERILYCGGSNCLRGKKCPFGQKVFRNISVMCVSNRQFPRAMSAKPPVKRPVVIKRPVAAAAVPVPAKKPVAKAKPAAVVKSAIVKPKAPVQAKPKPLVKKPPVAAAKPKPAPAPTVAKKPVQVIKKTPVASRPAAAAAAPVVVAKAKPAVAILKAPIKAQKSVKAVIKVPESPDSETKEVGTEEVSEEESWSWKRVCDEIQAIDRQCEYKLLGGRRLIKGDGLPLEFLYEMLRVQPYVVAISLSEEAYLIYRNPRQTNKWLFPTRVSLLATEKKVHDTAKKSKKSKKSSSTAKNGGTSDNRKQPWRTEMAAVPPYALGEKTKILWPLYGEGLAIPSVRAQVTTVLFNGMTISSDRDASFAGKYRAWIADMLEMASQPHLLASRLCNSQMPIAEVCQQFEEAESKMIKAIVRSNREVCRPLFDEEELSHRAKMGHALEVASDRYYAAQAVGHLGRLFDQKFCKQRKEEAQKAQSSEQNVLDEEDDSVQPAVEGGEDEDEGAETEAEGEAEGEAEAEAEPEADAEADAEAPAEAEAEPEAEAEAPAEAEAEAEPDAEAEAEPSEDLAAVEAEAEAEAQIAAEEAEGQAEEEEEADQ